MIRETPSELSKEELIALIATLRAENAALKARMAELERRLELNSSNSGKPPSSDGLKKPARVRNLRERSGKKPGGQMGHKGETLRQVTDPDVVVDHYPPACSTCGVGLDLETSVGHSARQVFDLPEPQPLVVTEHRAYHTATGTIREGGDGRRPASQETCR
jgi:transposase